MMGVMDVGRFASDIDEWRRPAGVPDVSLPESAPLAAEPAGAEAGGGYSPGRPRGTVLAAIVALHVAAVAGLSLARFEGERRDQAQNMVTFAIEDVSPPAPPPPPDEPVPPEPVVEPPAAPITAPRPPLELRREVNLPAAVLARPEPITNITLTVPPAPAPVAAPPEPAAPAPIVPPDFKAGQLNNPGPSYPYLSRKAREEGVVLLRVLVSVDGRAKQLKVEETSGHERLDEAALKTVGKWRFVPASQAGNPREAWVLVPVTFSLG